MVLLYRSSSDSAILWLAELRQHIPELERRVWRELVQPNASERRIGVLGLGELGSDAARKLAVFGFKVAGWSRRERRLPGIESFHGPDGLIALARRSDILVCLLPLTRDTAG